MLICRSKRKGLILLLLRWRLRTARNKRKTNQAADRTARANQCAKIEVDPTQLNRYESQCEQFKRHMNYLCTWTFLMLIKQMVVSNALNFIQDHVYVTFWEVRTCINSQVPNTDCETNLILRLWRMQILRKWFCDPEIYIAHVRARS